MKHPFQAALPAGIALGFVSGVRGMISHGNFTIALVEFLLLSLFWTLVVAVIIWIYRRLLNK